MTLRILKKRLAYWQSVLNAGHWSINLEWMDVKDAETCQGLCWWMSEELTADIRISKKTLHKEATLVHELLHIVFEGYKPPPDGYNIEKERALNNMTAALMWFEYK